MIRDITIGQYYPEESYVHRLDPRLKIIAVMAYIFSLFFIRHIAVYGLVALFLWFVVYASKVPVHYIFKGLKSIIFIVSFTVVINLFMTPGDIVLLSFWRLRVTYEGLYAAILIGLRLVFLIMGSSMLTLTTSPIQLTDGIESLLKPFKKIGVPSHDIAMMMTIALRFIPNLLEETDKIMKAQMARGADFDTGGLIKKAKSLIPLLVPLFLSAFRRADDLALAMEARCYNGDNNRTKMRELKYTKLDLQACFIFFIYIAGITAMRVFL